MSSKFYIHWKTNHILKVYKHRVISEYCIYNVAEKEHNYVYHIPNGYIIYITSLLKDSVSEKNIFTSGLKLYYFDGNILQCGLNEIYTMQRVNENVFSCNHLFLIVDESTLYLLEVDQRDQLLNEMSHYYSITELIFLYAKSCTKLYEWRSLYDNVITVQINEKRNIIKMWLNAEITHGLILNPLNYI